ncbi:hypothetical protein [Pseudophaeobacter sp.]|uniref:hypothetical protein n=1 Tax=Pseudophaeobacter sp. TaxID=1971739 RepID=UPI00329A14DB
MPHFANTVCQTDLHKTVVPIFGNAFPAREFFNGIGGKPTFAAVATDDGYAGIPAIRGVWGHSGCALLPVSRHFVLVQKMDHQMHFLLMDLPETYVEKDDGG